MAEEGLKTREELVLQANTNQADKLALAWQGHNELIEVAWQTYEATRAQAQAIYEATEKDIEIEFQEDIAAIEAGVAAKTVPPPTLLTGADAADGARGGGPDDPPQKLSPTAAGHTDDMEPIELTKGILSPDSKFLLEIRKLNDDLISYQEAIDGLELLANEYGRNAGEIKVITDGLQATRDLVLDWNSTETRLAEEILGESKKGDDSHEVNESGR